MNMRGQIDNARLARIDPHKTYDEMMEVADRYVEANYIADMADAAAEHAYDRAFLALKDEPGSVERKKAQARLNTTYQDALKAAIEARKHALKGKLEWQAVTTKLEFQRTLETSLRAQAQHIDKERG